MTGREKWRRVIVLVAATVAVSLVLFPPWAWESVKDGVRITGSDGHDWVWSGGGLVDYGRLGLELGAVAVVAGALLFAITKK